MLTATIIHEALLAVAGALGLKTQRSVASDWLGSVHGVLERNNECYDVTVTITRRVKVRVDRGRVRP